MPSIKSLLAYKQECTYYSHDMSKLLLPCAFAPEFQTEHDNSGTVAPDSNEKMYYDIYAKSAGARILVGRLYGYQSYLEAQHQQKVSLKITKGVVMFLSCLCSSPGQAVMWAHALAECILSLPNEKRPEVFAIEHLLAYFDQFPTDAVYKKTWEAQKGYTNSLPNVDNMIDDYANWYRKEPNAS